MTPASLFDLFAPRRLARAAAAFAMGFTVSQSQFEALGSGLADIRARGVLVCGVDTGLPGFAQQDADGRWQGFEIDLCHAYAAAFLGDSERVRFVPLTSAERLTALADGRVDILLRSTSWTFTRAAQMPVTFAGTYYYDGQGFLAPADLGVASARELDGARICVQASTTSLLNLNDFAGSFALTLTPVLAETPREAREAFEAGRCDVITADVSALAGLRLSLPEPDAHVILPDIISKEPLGPVVAARDPRFAEAARWVLHALITAEEYGVTAANAAGLRDTARSPVVRRLLGTEGAMGEGLGLEADFALNAISARGHYGELFARHLGAQSPLRLERGLNAQWSEGGLLYAPPFR
ncbi:MAG: transporter substrate-binding domain-containing protein [Alphaproteobacteria bacterium]|nr:transporter substrate-binding domain-containing protein [Alphaproteobacteria bacterium]